MSVNVFLRENMQKNDNHLTELQTLQKWFASDICWCNLVIKIKVSPGNNLMEIKRETKTLCGQNCFFFLTIIYTYNLKKNCVCGFPLSLVFDQVYYSNNNIKLYTFFSTVCNSSLNLSNKLCIT